MTGQDAIHPKKIKPIIPLESIGSDFSDIAKATRPMPSMPPVSMATQIPTNEETTSFIPTAPVDNRPIGGHAETTSEIPTGQAVPKAERVITTNVIPNAPSALSEDQKFGKAFNIAKSTLTELKIRKVDDFINLVEKIKSNL